MKYDLIVIGSGPGGYVAAIRAAQLGMKTAIVERYATLGGTCLNVGCIPSKALLDSSEHYHAAKSSFATHGIKVAKLDLDMPQMIARKDDVVKQNSVGVQYLMDKNKIEVHKGHATFKDKNTITVAHHDGATSELTSSQFIIATGSKPNTPAFMHYDKKRVITSTEALNIDKLPQSMVVVGAGVIGLELGSVFARLGTKITFVEYQKDILPGMDKDCCRELKKNMKKQLGVEFNFEHGVTKVENKGSTVVTTAKNNKTGEEVSWEADYCLIAIGRRPYTDNLGLENIGITLDDRGFVQVDHHLQTAVQGIYAVGDVVGGAMLAHKAEEEGVLVAEIIAGQKPHINYNLIPGVVYTWPEVSAVGQTEEQLKEAGIPFRTGKFPFKALGRARASMDLDGLAKVIVHADTDEILGVHIVGARAADIIGEAVIAMEFRATAEDVARSSHAHPTYAEALKEASLAATADRARQL